MRSFAHKRHKFIGWIERLNLEKRSGEHIVPKEMMILDLLKLARIHWINTMEECRNVTNNREATHSLNFKPVSEILFLCPHWLKI